jgi:CCR4-NOT transcription complex subunit 10
MTFLKSQLEYMRGNYQKAIRMLCSMAPQMLIVSKSLSPSGQGVVRNAAAMYYNNLGVLHFHMRKHNLGLFYMRRALEENTNAMREGYLFFCQKSYS